MRSLSALRLGFELILIAAIVLMGIRLVESSATIWRHDIIHTVPTNSKLVALTYDDGPYPEYTPKVLDVLKQYNVKATFFMIGKEMEQHPEIVKRVIAEGHAIGNHTYSHPRNLEKLSSEKIKWELEKCEKLIEQFTGQRAHIFRPPRGMINGDVARITEEEGYWTILWTVSADHHDAPTPIDMAYRVKKIMKNGGIILAHDGTFKSRWKDVAATPLIIQELRKEGYKFVTIPELLDANREYTGKVHE